LVNSHIGDSVVAIHESPLLNRTTLNKQTICVMATGILS